MQTFEKQSGWGQQIRRGGQNPTSNTNIPAETSTQTACTRVRHKTPDMSTIRFTWCIYNLILVRFQSAHPITRFAYLDTTKILDFVSPDALRLHCVQRRGVERPGYPDVSGSCRVTVSVERDVCDDSPGEA